LKLKIEVYEFESITSWTKPFLNELTVTQALYKKVP